MPTYDYHCSNCGHDMEVFHGMNESPALTCPVCNSSSVHKRIGAGSGIVFKGSGFYVTDYKKDKSGSSSGSDSGGSSG